VIESEKGPYPGLRPFEAYETHLFFGRDGCVDEMVARLGQRRFLAVLGSSGTGKSSLVRTGLFSGLEMGLLPGAGSRWLIAEFRPGGNPLCNLAEALLKAENKARKKPRPTEIEIASLQTRFEQQGPRELIKWCQEGHLGDDTNLLVVVDQFEELFRYQSDDDREQAQALVSLLLESRWPRGTLSPRASDLPIYVAITMRSEYLGACTLLQGLAEAINEGTYLTPRMKRRECEEAIIGPARVCGIEVEPRLVARLLNDLADFAPWGDEKIEDQLSVLARRADQLPLMQHALNRIWHRARKQRRTGTEEITLKLADYHGLEQELNDHAEEVFGQLDVSVQPTAELVFRAVTLGTTVANAVRRPTRFGELLKICGPKSEGAVRAVLGAFGPGSAQFLTSDRSQAGEQVPEDVTINIAHESLIRQWKRLSRWLEDEGRASHEWRLLKERAERKDLLSWRGLVDALAFRNVSKPAFAWTWRSLMDSLNFRSVTRPWAERYGGGFDRVTWLIKKSAWRQFRRALIGLVAVAAVLSLAAYSYQKNQEFVGAKKAAITSAQKLLDHLKVSLPRGDITLNGANNILQVAQDIVGQQQRDLERTSEYIRLLVNVGSTASDIHGDIGNYPEAYRTAKEARDLVEPLRTEHPDDPEILQLLYITTWRIGDAISYRGSDSQNQNEALKEYLDAKALA
jgi:hypothetical protein